MPVTTLVSAELAPADQQAVLAAIATIRAKLPFLIDLSAEDRAGLVKFGPKSHLFVEKSLQTAQANAQIIPPAFDLAEFARDYALWQSLQPIAVQLMQLQEFFDDTIAALGSDLYSEALAAYTYMKASGSGQGIDDLKTMLGQRFARKSAPPAPAPVPA